MGIIEIVATAYIAFFILFGTPADETKHETNAKVAKHIADKKGSV